MLKIVRPAYGLGALLLFFGALVAHAAGDEPVNANRLTYLDEFCDPYYVGRDFPKLTTPQWVGEEGVEAVVVLAIDDMRGHATWEAYLRPILERLKKIDGRAPVSIMTCKIDPADPHLQTWLKEGLSIEVHTIDHPCPCLQGGDFAKAAKTYHDCVDLMSNIPGNRPVAFRMPCCDSRNTPSPRFWTEIFNRTSSQKNFLQIDSSVFNITTPDDSSLPRELVVDDEGKPRFRRYLPFPSFVNTIEDYPYPYVIGGRCWEFPCVVPSDWEAQNIQRPNNPLTVADMQRVLDATVAKQGVYNLVFHPHGWIRNDQIVELIDYAEKTHGRKVKFLNFRECAERLNKNLLAGHPLRTDDGGDNGVRLMDLNADGFQDVVIGNKAKRVSRIWNNDAHTWRECEFPTEVADVRFGILLDDGHPACIELSDKRRAAWQFDGKAWITANDLLRGLEIDGAPVLTAAAGRDQGVRLRDFDGDGRCELLVANPRQQGVFRWNGDARHWEALKLTWPKTALLVDDNGKDAGLRFADFTGDGRSDILFANASQWLAHPFVSLTEGWPRGASGKQGEARSLPPIVRGDTNNGAWLHSEHIWVQNEDTSALPDGVARAKFSDIAAWCNDTESEGENAGLPGPLSPKESLATMRVRPGLKIELVAAEPLVVDPIAFDWGPDGRLWVVEMRDYPLGMDGKGKPGGRVKVLTDVDDDGDYDKADIFLDDVPYPTGVKVWRSGVLVTTAPRILYAEDTDDDQRADKVETLYEGFGEGNQQHRVNGLRWGLDNWLYVGNGDSGGAIRSLKTEHKADLRQRDLRIRPDEGLLEAISGNTQFGINQDDWGNWFGGNNSTPAWHYVLDDVMLRRNPHFAPPAVRREISVMPGPARVYPLSKTFERFNDHARANHFTSACSPEIYRDRALGDEFYGNIFVCEPVHNLVHREIVSPQGVSFSSRRADDERETEFLASTDNWFRPTMIRTGPDGALWVADMYRLVIEHPQWIPAEWQARLNLRAGDDRGRIYRIVPEKQDSPRVPRLHASDAQQLAKALESPNGVVRDQAQQLLLWKGDEKSVVELNKLLRESKSPLARLHAICTLDGMQKLTPEAVRVALRDEHAGVRRHAVRLSAQFDDKALAADVAKLVNDNEPTVRLQVAYSAGFWKDGQLAGQVLSALFVDEKADGFVRAAAMSSLNSQNIGEVISLSLGDEQNVSSKFINDLIGLAAALGARDALKPALDRVARPGSDGAFASWQFATAARILSQLSTRDDLQETKAAVQRQLEPLLAAAREMIVSDDAAPELRVAALSALRSAPPEGRPKNEVLLSLLHSGNDPEVHLAALANLLLQNDDASLGALFSGWRGYSPALRARIVENAIGNEPTAHALLEQVASGVIASNQFDAIRRRALLEHRSEAIRRRAKEIFSTAASSSRQELIDKYAKAAAQTGDVNRGRELFAKHCAACHRLGDVGHAVGPDLATLSNRSPEVLRVAILDPNRAVEDKYLGYTVVARDGRVISGMLVGESGGALTLQSADGKSHELLRKDIEELASSEKSFMPEGLEQDLSPEALADVIAFVRSIGAPPKRFDGNQPATVTASDDGVLHLQAAAASIYGRSLIFESRYKNLGYWASADDRAAWTASVPKAGRYRVAIDYACQNDSAGNTLELEFGSQQLNLKVEGTGTWDDYRWLDVGVVELNDGQREISARANGPLRHALIDLREIRLTPVK